MSASRSLGDLEARSQLSEIVGELRAFLDKHSLRDALPEGATAAGLGVCARFFCMQLGVGS